MPDDAYQPFSSPFRPSSGPAPYAPYSGLPGMLGMAPAFMLPPTGSFNFGFNPSSNLFYTVDSQQRTQAYYDALRQAAHRDAPLFPKFGEAYAAVRGYEFTPEMRQNAERIGGSLTDPNSGFNLGAFAPFAMPQLDMLSGGMSQIPLTHHLARMDRWRMGTDGGRKMTAGNYADLSQSFYDFYANDPATGKEDLGGFHKRTGGMSLGQIGELTHEMSVMGQLPQGNTQNITRKVEEYRKVVGYLRDLFVGEGRDAPIPTLVSALEQLSGGMQQLDPNRVGTVLTQFAQAGKALGYNLDTMVTVAQMSSAQAQAAGINEAFAMPVAAESMLFRQDVQARGLPRAWGLPSADRLTLMYQAQQARAIGSEFGNRLGFMGRMAQEHGVSIEALDAARRGDVGNAAFRSSVMQSEEKFLEEMAAQTGRPIEELRSELRSNLANEEAIYNLGLAGAAKSAQNIDFYSRMERSGRGAFTLGGLISARTGRGAGATSLAGRLDTWMRSTMQGMSAEDLMSGTVRKAAFGTSVNEIRKAAGGTGPEAEAARALLRDWESKGLDAEEEAARMMGITFNRLSEDHRRETGKTLETEIALQQKSRIEGMAGDRAEAATKAEAAKLGSGGLIPGVDPSSALGRMYEQLMKARQGGEGAPKSMTEAVASVMGLDVTDARAKEMADLVEGLQTRRARLSAEREEKTVEAIKKYGVGSEEVRKIQTSYEEEMKALQAEEQKFLNTPGVKEKVEDKKSGEGDGKGGGLSLHGVTININGEPLIKADEAKGTVTSRGRGEGAT